MAKRKYNRNQTSITEQLYLTILESIRENHKLPKNLLSKSLLQYYVSRLKKEGKIKKVGFGVWEVVKPQTSITDTGVLPIGTGGLVSSGKVDFKGVRLHNLVFKILLDKPIDWKALFDGRSIEYRLIHYDTTFKVVFEGFKVWFVRDRVIVYVKSSLDFKAVKVGEALRLGLEWFYGFVARIESFIGFSLFQVDGLVWSVNRKHLSLVKNALAMGMGSRGERLCVRDSKGVWLITDRSNSVDELEFIRNSTNTSEVAIVDNFFNYLKIHPTFYIDFMKVVEAQAINMTILTMKVKEIFDFLNDRFGGGF